MGAVHYLQLSLVILFTILSQVYDTFNLLMNLLHKVKVCSFEKKAKDFEMCGFTASV